MTCKKRGPRQGKVPTPGPTAHSVPADDPSAPGPVAVATGAGGGLLGPAVGASLAHSPGLMAWPHCLSRPPGPISSERRACRCLRGRLDYPLKRPGATLVREGRSVDILAIDPRARLPGLTPVRNAGAMAPCLGQSFFTQCSPLRPRCQPCLLITQAVCRVNSAPLVPHFRVSILTRAGRLGLMWAHLTRSAVRPPLPLC